MATPVIPPPPPGFTLDPVPPPPPGFTLDAAPAPAPAEVPLDDQVPVANDPAVPVQNIQNPEPSIWDKFLSATGIDRMGGGDPIVDMYKHGLPIVAQGAPEVAMNMVGNTGVQAAAGLAAPFSEGLDTNSEDAANFVTDFTQRNSMQPQGENAKLLTEGLGEAFAPLQNVKSKLGDTALDAGAGPLAATTADLLPDLGMALFGGPKAAGVAEKAAEAVRPPLRAPVSPVVENLRAADIRMRPSDVRAMNPDKKVKVPGEFREKFASGPQLKEDLTLHNQAKLTAANAKDLGVKDLTEASLAKAKEAPGAVYDMVERVLADKPRSADMDSVFKEASASARLPKGDNASVTRVLGALRRRAAKRMQSDDVKTEDAGFADRDMADRLEEELGRELKVNGEPQLFGEFKDARKQFAKIHDVETATRAGQIDANVVYKLGKRGAPLSGALKLTADAAEHAPNVTGHSLKTAARAGEEVPNSREGFITRGTKKLIRSIPGMDVGAEGFQNTLGKADPARSSYYGTEPVVPTPRSPEPGALDLRETMDLEPPPGEVGVALPSFMRKKTAEIGPQVDALGNAFEFDAPPGEVGIPPPEQISLQDILGLGEPLTLKNAPGRVGKPPKRLVAEAPSAVQGLLDKYDSPDGGVYTVRDMVDDVDSLVAEGRAPAELADAVDAFRSELDDDFALGGRGDMDSAEEAFLDALRNVGKPPGRVGKK